MGSLSNPSPASLEDVIFCWLLLSPFPEFSGSDSVDGMLPGPADLSFFNCLMSSIFTSWWVDYCGLVGHRWLVGYLPDPVELVCLETLQSTPSISSSDLPYPG